MAVYDTMEAVLTFSSFKDFNGFHGCSLGAFLVCSQIFSDTNDPTPMLYLFAQLISQEAARPQSPKFMPEDFSAFE
jgi:hypothetical protein